MKLVSDLTSTSAAHRPRAAFTPMVAFSAGEDGCWLDPSDPGSMFEDAAGTIPALVDGRVGRIEDKSGNGNHAVQNSPWARPILRLDSTSRPYLEFDGVDDVLVSGLTGLGRDDIAATVACGYLGTGATTGYILNPSGDSSNVATHGFSLLYRQDEGEALMTVGGDGNSRPLASDTPQCVAAAWDRNTPTGQVFWDGENAVTLSIGSFSDDQPLRIGARVTGAFFAGRVYGVIARKAATDQTTLARLRNFVCLKTGVSLG